MGWEVAIPMLIKLGVKSWALLHALQENAGLDDAQIAINKTHWDALYNDVERASKPPVSKGPHA